MRQVFPHPLWLGHADDGRDFATILSYGIQAVVQLAAEEPSPHMPRELIFCRFPLVDGPGNDPKLLRLALGTLAKLIERRIPTLVCCGGGLSRSPALAAAAMAVTFQLPPDECLKKIAEEHSADVVPGLWKEVRQLVATEGDTP